MASYKKLQDQLSSLYPELKRDIFSHPDKYRNAGSYQLQSILQPYYQDKIRKDLPKGLLEGVVNNVGDFVKSKNYAVIDDLVYSTDKSYEIFSQIFDVKMSLYNETWLETEANQITRSSNMAIQMTNFQRYPKKMLQYMTMEDSIVRPSHAAINNVTLPANDPFWSQYNPSLSYNCRCRIKMLFEDVEQSDASEVETAIDNGIGYADNGTSFTFQTGKVFSKEHTYFERSPQNVTLI